MLMQGQVPGHLDHLWQFTPGGEIMCLTRLPHVKQEVTQMPANRLIILFERIPLSVCRERALIFCNAKSRFY